MKKSTIAGLAALALAVSGLCANSRAFAQDAAPTVPAMPSVPEAPAVPAAAAPAMDAAAAAAKPMKAKKPKGAGGLAKTPVVFKNSSGLGLVELDAVISGRQDSAKIAGPLATGKTVRVMVARDATCLFDIHASYDDGSTGDASGLDLCKQKTITLTPP
jgi:hypothetical protein